LEGGTEPRRDLCCSLSLSGTGKSLQRTPARMPAVPTGPLVRIWYPFPLAVGRLQRLEKRSRRCDSL
jgi:hypothetical protein